MNKLGAAGGGGISVVPEGPGLLLLLLLWEPVLPTGETGADLLT